MQFGSDGDRYSLIVDVIERNKFKAAIGLQTEDKCVPEVLSFGVHRLTLAAAHGAIAAAYRLLSG